MAAKITKDQYNVLNAIMQYRPDGDFSARDIAEAPRVLAGLERKGILCKSPLRYVGSDEQLYTVNFEAARAAYQGYEGAMKDITIVKDDGINRDWLVYHNGEFIGCGIDDQDRPSYDAAEALAQRYLADLVSGNVSDPKEYQTLVNGFRLPPLLAEPDAIYWAKHLAKFPGVWATSVVKAVV